MKTKRYLIDSKREREEVRRKRGRKINEKQKKERRRRRKEGSRYPPHAIRFDVTAMRAVAPPEMYN